jgi:hypothetical protein
MVTVWFGVGQFLSGAMGQLYPGGDKKEQKSRAYSMKKPLKWKLPHHHFGGHRYALCSFYRKIAWIKRNVRQLPDKTEILIELPRKPHVWALRNICANQNLIQIRT